MLHCHLVRAEAERVRGGSQQVHDPNIPIPIPDSCFWISDIGQTSDNGRQKLDGRYMDLVESSPCLYSLAAVIVGYFERLMCLAAYKVEP
jgi:hypothetical protein